MVLELGPCPAEDVLRWSKFARRILVQLRSDCGQGLVSPDVVDLWANTVDAWSSHATALDQPDLAFRWSGDMEPEVVEFLLDGLDKCLHSPTVMSWVTPEEAAEQRAFTMLIVRAFVDGLLVEGHSCQHYADEILVSMGDLLQD
jgi:hypothetical protein